MILLDLIHVYVNNIYHDNYYNIIRKLYIKYRQCIVRTKVKHNADSGAIDFNAADHHDISY